MKYGRVYNFSAGPAMMPEEVLEDIAAEVLNYRGSGMSVMEMSHRSQVYQKILDDAEADLRKLMGIPENYKVLFVQGGGTVQFAMVPMNLMKNGVACYIETGVWSKKAIPEARRYGEVLVPASSALGLCWHTFFRRIWCSWHMAFMACGLDCGCHNLCCVLLRWLLEKTYCLRLFGGKSGS